jgi:hypothetical protein
VSADGNFEGANILSVVGDRRTVAAHHKLNEDQLDETIARAKQTLYDIRQARVWPGLDDKVLASWNGLMVRGIAEAARAFGNAKYREVAIAGGEFLFARLVDNGRVYRSFKAGRARIAGYLEDHASLGLAALSLYELTFDATWLTRARAMRDATVQWFWDDSIGAFFDTAVDHEQLITRPREVTDNATPSGTSLAVELLLRFADLYDDDASRRRAMYVVESLAPAMARYPTAFGHMLGNADMVINGAIELAIVGDLRGHEFHALANAASSEYVPSLVVAGGAAGETEIALLRDRSARDGRATAYVCRNYACEEPATSVVALVGQLERVGRSG